MNKDVLDVRDLIDEFEVLEAEILEGLDGEYTEDELAALIDLQSNEYKELKRVLDELSGCGGDHQWRGDWYPVSLISEEYFTEYAQEFVRDCGYIPNNLPAFIENNIAWDGVADDMKQDYNYVNIGGETYYYN